MSEKLDGHNFKAEFSEDDLTLVMQNLLYEDCVMVRQHKQRLADEEYARELQERFDAELAAGATSLSLTENHYEDISYGEAESGNTTIVDPFAPFEHPFCGNYYWNRDTYDSDDEPAYEIVTPGHSVEYDVEEDEYELSSSHLIDLLPTKSHNSSQQFEISSENKSCRICLLAWETGDLITSLPCFHDFHSDCIDSWIKIKHTCPVCRHKIKLEEDCTT